MKAKPEYLESFYYVEAMYRAGGPASNIANGYLESGNTACKAIKLRRFHKAGAPPIPGEARWLSFGWRILSARDAATMDDIRREERIV